MPQKQQWAENVKACDTSYVFALFSWREPVGEQGQNGFPVLQAPWPCHACSWHMAKGSKLVQSTRKLVVLLLPPLASISFIEVCRNLGARQTLEKHSLIYLHGSIICSRDMRFQHQTLMKQKMLEPKHWLLKPQYSAHNWSEVVLCSCTRSKVPQVARRPCSFLLTKVITKQTYTC